MSGRRGAGAVVLDSIETPDGTRCVDLFRRPDGTFGFEEYRRDPEDGGGWTPVTGYSALVYPDRAAALAAARARVGWMATLG